MSNDAARELGRRGGQKRAENLSAEERSEIARKAADARWSDHGGLSDDDAEAMLTAKHLRSGSR